MAQTPLSVVYMDPHLFRTSGNLCHRTSETTVITASFLPESFLYFLEPQSYKSTSHLYRSFCLAQEMFWSLISSFLNGSFHEVLALSEQIISILPSERFECLLQQNGRCKTFAPCRSETHHLAGKHLEDTEARSLRGWMFVGCSILSLLVDLIRLVLGVSMSKGFDPAWFHRAGCLARSKLGDSTRSTSCHDRPGLVFS